jgi:cardiolipin synthase A/B
MLLLAGFGALALVTVTVTLFFSLGRRSPELVEATRPPVDSAEFAAMVAGTAGTPLAAGGTARLLHDGDEFFPRLLEALGNARHTINFSVYIWEDGKVSDMVVPVLRERAQSGVEVRILLDGLGSLKAPDEEMKRLRAVGVKIATYRSPRLGKLTRFHKRNHRRAIVIDGTTAFTGGMAIGDKWLGHAQTPENWRDTMVEVTGPLATSVQSAFVAPWTHTTGEILAGPHFFPPQARTGAAGTRTALRGRGSPQQIAWHTGIASSPSSENHPLRLFMAQTFLSAQRRIYITTPYFIPDDALRKALMERARAGVDVRVLSNGDHTDAKPIRLASHSYYEELLAAGVKIFEYEKTMIHTKHIVVDGVWCVVGSPNMDVRSKELNEENVLGIVDTGLGAELEKTFLEDQANAREIQLEEWKQRGWFVRIEEKIAALLEEQY